MFKSHLEGAKKEIGMGGKGKGETWVGDGRVREIGKKEETEERARGAQE